MIGAGETGWSVLRRAATRMHNRILRVQGATRAFRSLCRADWSLHGMLRVLCVVFVFADVADCH